MEQQVEKWREDGINGLGEGLVDTNASDFKALQAAIKGASGERDKMKRMRDRFLGIRFQMETYLENEDANYTPAGNFLAQLIEAIPIKKQEFAHYISYNSANLSALLKGRRRVNTKLAIMLGAIFGMSPTLWLRVETKNELQLMVQEKGEQLTHYSLDQLLAQTN